MLSSHVNPYFYFLFLKFLKFYQNTDKKLGSNKHSRLMPNDGSFILD